jgi:hypothetical protein
MTCSEQIDRALNEIGEAFGARLVFDEHRIATIECANDVLCSIEAPRDAAHVYFHAPVTRLPKVGREAALQHGLRLNLFCLSLPGSSVALDETSDELILCYAEPGDAIDAGRLAGIMTALVEQVGALRALFQSATRAGDHLSLAADFSVLIRG